MDQEDWLAVLREVCPTGKGSILLGLSKVLPHTFDMLKLDTIDLQAMALGQWATEAGGFKSLEENLNYTTLAALRRAFKKRIPASDAEARRYLKNPKGLALLVYSNRLGNRPNTEDGWTYRGGGFDQTTGRYNYEQAGFAENPERLRTLEGALGALCTFWLNNNLTPIAKTGSVERLTRAINGGTNGLSERKAYTAKFKKAIAEHHEVELDDEDEHEETQDEEEPTPAPVVPKKKVLSKPEIMGLQKRLKELGYNEVGTVDGVWGAKTRGALAAFQTDKGIRPVTGQTDEATMLALAEPFVRPVSEARLMATTSTLAAEGNVAAKQTLQQKAGAWLLGAGGTSVAAVKGAYAYFDDAKDQVSEWAGHFETVPLWLVLLVSGAVAMWWWYSADKAGKDLVAAKRDGRLA